jgi:hypothetical protein
MKDRTSGDARIELLLACSELAVCIDRCREDVVEPEGLSWPAKEAARAGDVSSADDTPTDNDDIVGSVGTDDTMRALPTRTDPGD